MCGAGKNMIAGSNFNNNMGFYAKTLMNIGQMRGFGTECSADPLAERFVRLYL